MIESPTLHPAAAPVTAQPGTIEFYGLYGMVGRFSNITGPAIWALVTFLTIDLLDLQPRVGQGIGVLVLLALVITRYVILRPVSDQACEWQGADLHGPDAA